MPTTLNAKMTIETCHEYRTATAGPLEILVRIPPIERVAGQRVTAMGKSKAERIGLRNKWYTEVTGQM